VYITEEGEILIKPRESGQLCMDERQVEELCRKDPYAGMKQELANDDDEKKSEDFSVTESTDSSQVNPKYERMLKLVPSSLKNHMPDFYLQPLIRLFEREQHGSHITLSYTP
jgi:hypothetical protein